MVEGGFSITGAKPATKKKKRGLRKIAKDGDDPNALDEIVVSAAPSAVNVDDFYDDSAYFDDAASTSDTAGPGAARRTTHAPSTLRPQGCVCFQLLVDKRVFHCLTSLF